MDLILPPFVISIVTSFSLTSSLFLFSDLSPLYTCSVWSTHYFLQWLFIRALHKIDKLNPSPFSPPFSRSQKKLEIVLLCEKDAVKEAPPKKNLLGSLNLDGKLIVFFTFIVTFSVLFLLFHCHPSFCTRSCFLLNFKNDFLFQI